MPISGMAPPVSPYGGKRRPSLKPARSAQGDLLLQEGGIDWILNWRAAEPGMYKFSVRFRNADIAGRHRIDGNRLRQARICPQKSKPYRKRSDTMSSAPPRFRWLRTSSGSNYGAIKGTAGRSALTGFTLEPLPEYRCEAAPPTPDLTRLDAVEEPFQVQLKFRKYDKNSRGAVIERAEGDGPFVEIARLGAYLHSAVDPGDGSGHPLPLPPSKIFRTAANGIFQYS